MGAGSTHRVPNSEIVLKIQFGLMGGLGNQLFQMSAALNIAKGCNQKVILNPNFGHIRNNENGKPEILSYTLPPEIIVTKRGIQSRWISKLFGHARKIGVSPIGIEKSIPYRIFINFLSRCQAVLLVGFKSQINFIDEVGYHEIGKVAKNTIYIGYFQSYKYLITDDIKADLMNLITCEFEETQKFYKKLRENTNPLVVHIRLGDYLNESNFGIVSSEYYKAAIQREFKTELYDSIWLFSDELNHALDMIPIEFKPKVRLVGEAQNSSAATLEIMRLGKGFVIGNSTYSWWGATLSRTPNARVTAPTPWFKGMPEPRELIPPHWERIQA